MTDVSVHAVSPALNAGLDAGPGAGNPASAHDAGLSPQVLAQLLDSSLGATLSVVSPDLKFLYVNAGFATAFGFTPEAMRGMLVHDVYGDAQYPVILAYLRRALAGESVHYERLGRIRLVEQIWRTVSMNPWRDADGQVIGVVTASLTVHELKSSTEALRMANERLSSHMDNSPLAVLELDARLNIMRASHRVTSMLGLQPRALAGQPLLPALAALAALAGEELQDSLAVAFVRLQTGDEARNRVESTHTRPDGSTVHCEWFNSALTDADGQVTSIMALVEDVSARVQAQAQLRHLALHDPLTGLPNRSALADHLKASLARALRTHEPVALLFIDLDGFKGVNDDFGHAAGDEVLVEITRRLLTAVRETDVVARMGGDEFVVLLDTEVRDGTADLVCSRMLEALSVPCHFANGQATVGASIGVATHPPLPNHAADLLKCADAAMYQAKRAGKGCVRYFESQTGL